MTARVLPRFKQAISRYELIPSKGGCFELKVGDRLIYSKLKTGQFPDEDKILKELSAILDR